jgi:serine/threonine-protein kinase
MVLEYLDGTDLSKFPRAHLTPPLIVDLMLQACEALAESHTLEIIHRDIKPANFFVTRGADGSLLLKILDFGISKAPSTDPQLTATQMVMGTPAYMSPEQMKSSRSVDGRSDIWSLGVVMYELLQGATPFQADTFSSMIIKVATEEMPPMLVRLPPGLAEIVYRCLDKDLARRFQNVAELAQALAPYAQSPTQASISVARTRRVVGGAQPSGTGPFPAVFGAPTPPPIAPRRRWPIVVGIVGAIAIAAVIASVAAGGGHDPAPAIAAPAAAPPIAAPVPVAPPPAVVTPPPPAPPAPTEVAVPTLPAEPAGSAAPPAGHAVTRPRPKSPRPSGKPADPTNSADEVLGSRN